MRGKNLDAGVISLAPISEFVESHRVIPHGRDGFREYSAVCDKLTEHVPKTSGWYLWLPSRRRSNTPIYIGKAEKTMKGNSLRYRIDYELKTERICFWAKRYGEKAFDDHHRFYGGRYDSGARRAIKKGDGQFIIWISDPDASSAEVREVERILINRFQPRVNVQRAKRSRAFEKANEATSLLHRLQS